MSQDIWKFVAIISLGALLGYSLGSITLGMLIPAIGIIAWQMHRLRLMHLWAKNPLKNPMPEMSGQFYLLHKEFNRRNNQSQNRKKKLTTFLSQFRAAVGALPDAIVLIDGRGKIEWANPNANTVLGIQWPSDSGVRFSDLIRHPEVEQLINVGGDESGVVISSLRKQDQTISVKCVRYTDRLRMIIARDVSLLIQVNQLHTDFVANVSHELKTPLTVLRGYVEILEGDKNMPEKYVKPMEQMRVQATRMQFIVNDLLYLAKLENASEPVVHERVDVTNLINTIVEAVQPLIEEKRHKLELDIDYGVLLTGAATELHSAFSNLITNAINYTPESGLIRIRWQGNEDGGEFSVRDNGYGIAAHHVERLTQRFYRVDTDRSREGGGTGLGLAIVKHVLQRHSATLEIDSIEGYGSTFSCQFPAEKVSILDAKNTSVHEESA